MTLGVSTTTCCRSRSICASEGGSCFWRLGVRAPTCFSENGLLSWYGACDQQGHLFGNLSPAGRDASRAFVTGDYSEAGLVDDVADLSFSEVLTLQNWLSFYEKNYKFVGR